MDGWMDGWKGIPRMCFNTSSSSNHSRLTFRFIVFSLRVARTLTLTAFGREKNVRVITLQSVPIFD